MADNPILPQLPDEIPIDLKRWSDPLQRRIEIPASTLWPMACLAHEVGLGIASDARTPELDAWLWQVQQGVVEIVGADSWDEAVEILHISVRKRRSLAAWLKSGAAPPGIRTRLEAVLEGASADLGKAPGGD